MRHSLHLAFWRRGVCSPSDLTAVATSKTSMATCLRQAVTQNLGVILTVLLTGWKESLLLASSTSQDLTVPWIRFVVSC